ncbi:MAG TPA: hypothetical protein VG204_20960 [Terriglobia bacterium]|nr:hypothetical protein [Terriglobia bacterium]
MPKIEFEYLWRPVLVLAVLLGIAVWQVWGEPGKRRAAQRAIDAAVAACDQNLQLETDRRRDEASAAISHLEGADREMYQITLDNQLANHGCK